MEEARAEADRGRTAIVATAPLQARTSIPLSLTATLGKSTLVSASAPLSARGGYYCDVCLCLLKDSTTYLDHINGRKHTKALGMTMKVERVGVDAVKDKLQQWKERKDHDERANRAHLTGKRARRTDDDGGEEEEEEEGGAEEDRAGEERKEGKEESGTVRGDEGRERVIAAALSKTEEEAEEEVMMAAMGFKGFAAGKGT